MIDTPSGRGSQVRLFLSALVVVLSLWIQVQVVTRTVVRKPVRADAVSYVSYAWNIREHHVFSRARTWVDPSIEARPDKMTLPGYPAFLALMMTDAGPDPAFVHRVTFAQAVLGALTTLFVLLTASRLLPWGWSLATGLLVAVSPHLATFSTYLLTETLFTFLVCANLYALVRTADEPDDIRWAIASGITAGLASLVRPQWQLALLGLAIVVLVSKTHRKRWPQVAAVLLAMALFVVPWQIRNAHTSRSVSDPDLLATTLYHGSFPQLEYHGLPQSRGVPYRFDPAAGLHSQTTHSAFHWIDDEFRRNPVAMTAWYLVGKPIYFLSWDMISGEGDVYFYPVDTSPYLNDPVFKALRNIMYALHWPLNISALLVVATVLVATYIQQYGTAKKRVILKPTITLLATLMMALMVVHMLGAPFPRYGVPFRPLVILLAMMGIEALWRLRHIRPSM